MQVFNIAVICACGMGILIMIVGNLFITPLAERLGSTPRIHDQPLSIGSTSLPSHTTLPSCTTAFGEIGRRLAEEHGIACYGQNIVTELLKRTNLAEGYVRNVGKRYPMPLLPVTTAGFFDLKVTPKVEWNRRYQSVTKRVVIVEMAKKSDCITVGRCADYILQDMKLSGCSFMRIWRPGSPAAG